jgi:hypothetical protein
LDRGIGGALVGPSSYFMKSPPQQFADHIARELTLQFIKDALGDNPGRKRHRDQISARPPRDVRADG